MDEQNQYVSLRQAAQALGLPTYAIRKGVLTGKFPLITLGVKYYVIPEQIKETLEKEALHNQKQASRAAEQNNQAYEEV